jgi:hypothetical protein
VGPHSSRLGPVSCNVLPVVHCFIYSIYASNCIDGKRVVYTYKLALGLGLPPSGNKLFCETLNGGKFCLFPSEFRLLRAAKNAWNSVPAIPQMKKNIENLSEPIFRREKHSELRNFVPNHSAEAKYARNSIRYHFTEDKNTEFSSKPLSERKILLKSFPNHSRTQKNSRMTF